MENMIPYANAVKWAFLAVTTSSNLQILGSCVTTALTVMAAIVQSPNFPFILLFILRYLRLIVHMISFWLYKTTLVPIDPTYFPEDCTVIIPTVDPENPDFIECLTSILANKPSGIIIVTVGAEKLRLTREITAALSPSICVTAIEQANKHAQVCHALSRVRTRIAVLVDDHVFWPSTNFLRTMLAPFEDSSIAAVATNKCVRRDQPGFTFAAFWNVIGALYLERYNFELAATTNIDGGVFVTSSRTSAYRTAILHDPEFIVRFTNEWFGPLNTDDDKFITRWVVKRGWKVRFQCCEDATIETMLGQVLRWVRTTWRSNSASLFTDRTVWHRQPWCMYAMYWTSFFNFALFYDAALVFTLTKSTFGNATSLKCLAACIFASKLIKPLPYFWHRRQDLVFLSGCILFGYYHSLVKLYAGLTFWNASWGGQNLDVVRGRTDDGRDNDSDSNDESHTFSNDGSFVDSDSASSCSSESDGNNSNRGLAPGKLPPRPHWNKPLSTIKTPWGTVRASNLLRVPANVLEGQVPLFAFGAKKNTTKPAKTVVEITTSNAKVSYLQDVKGKYKRYGYLSNVYKRSWVRGDDCLRLHDHGTGLGNGHCILEMSGDSSSYQAA
jgi:cellulose synthase/poly-beta-1,6-N-acetylglucosamine synthase-like glycosyltransferase